MQQQPFSPASSASTVEHPNQSVSWLTPVVMAAAALVVVHGFGRFVYTPLLPLLVRDGLISLEQGVSLATINYLGYLIGAVLAFACSGRGFSVKAAVTALLINVAVNLIQVAATSYEFLALLRLINGVTNGVVFVLIPALMLEWLNEHGRASKSGLMYLGVGVGLVASALAVSLALPQWVGSQRWLTPALIQLPLGLVCALYLYKLFQGMRLPSATSHSKVFDRSTWPLILAYMGAGFGYILPLTFLPEVAHDWGVHLPISVWMLVALMSIPSTFFWNWLGARFGDVLALKWNYAAQAGSLLVFYVLPQGAWPLVCCAVLMGASFMGAVFLTQRSARKLHPHQGPRISAALVTLYAVTQLLGPVVTKWGLAHSMSLVGVFGFGLAACVWALVCMYALPKQVKHF